MVGIIEQTSSLTDEDWFFLSVSDMTEFKINPYDLKYNYTYIEVLQLREYLTIKSVKEEAYRRDTKLHEGK